MARADVGTDDRLRVRWVVENGVLSLDVEVGEVVDTSPVPLNAPSTCPMHVSQALPVPVDATRATVDLSGGVLTVRLARA